MLNLEGKPTSRDEAFTNLTRLQFQARSYLNTLPPRVRGVKPLLNHAVFLEEQFTFEQVGLTRPNNKLAI